MIFPDIKYGNNHSNVYPINVESQITLVLVVI